MDTTLIKLAIERLSEEVERLKTTVKNQQQEISELRNAPRIQQTPEPAKKEELDELLDNKDVKRIFQIGKNSLIKLVKEGMINMIRINQRSIRYTRSSIRDYINRQASKAN